MSSTTPWKFTNGPSMTRTLSPRWNTDFGLGFSAPASICRMMSSTCSCESGTGLEPEPTNPVTLGVERTRCHVSSVSSISTSTYPGKNFCSVSRFCLLRTSTTFSVGTRTRVIFSVMPKIFARDSMASLTLFSNPEYVWTTNHCLFVAAVVASPLIAGSFHDPRQHDVHAAQKEGDHDRDGDHHDRGVDQLLPVGPGHLAELREDLAEEFLRSLQNPHVVPALSVNINTWQGWRDSNPHPPDLESGALAVRATPLFSSEGTAARSEASPTADCDGKAPARTPMEPPLERGEVTPWSTVSTRRYFVSLCGVCLRHHRQYFFSSSRSGWVRL